MTPPFHAAFEIRDRQAGGDSVVSGDVPVCHVLLQLRRVRGVVATDRCVTRAVVCCRSRWARPRCSAQRTRLRRARSPHPTINGAASGRRAGRAWQGRGGILTEGEFAEASSIAFCDFSAQAAGSFHRCSGGFFRLS